MLKHADDVSFGFEPRVHGQGWLIVRRGSETYRLRKIDKIEYRSLRRWSEQTPQRVADIDQRTYWMYDGRCFSDDAGLTQRQVRLFLHSAVAG